MCVCIVLVKLTTDRHEASRGLSAIAGLLVSKSKMNNKLVDVKGIQLK